MLFLTLLTTGALGLHLNLKGPHDNTDDCNWVMDPFPVDFIFDRISPPSTAPTEMPTANPTESWMAGYNLTEGYNSDSESSMLAIGLVAGGFGALPRPVDECIQWEEEIDELDIPWFGNIGVKYTCITSTQIKREIWWNTNGGGSDDSAINCARTNPDDIAYLDSENPRKHQYFLFNCDASISCGAAEITISEAIEPPYQSSTSSPWTTNQGWGTTTNQGWGTTTNTPQTTNEESSTTSNNNNNVTNGNQWTTSNNVTYGNPSTTSNNNNNVTKGNPWTTSSYNYYGPLSTSSYYYYNFPLLDEEITEDIWTCSNTEGKQLPEQYLRTTFAAGVCFEVLSMFDLATQEFQDPIFDILANFSVNGTYFFNMIEQVLSNETFIQNVLDEVFPDLPFTYQDLTTIPEPDEVKLVTVDDIFDMINEVLGYFLTFDALLDQFEVATNETFSQHERDNAQSVWNIINGWIGFDCDVEVGNPTTYYIGLYSDSNCNNIISVDGTDLHIPIYDDECAITDYTWADITCTGYSTGATTTTTDPSNSFANLISLKFSAFFVAFLYFFL